MNGIKISSTICQHSTHCAHSYDNDDDATLVWRFFCAFVLRLAGGLRQRPNVNFKPSRMHSQASVLCETSFDAVAVAATKIQKTKRKTDTTTLDTDTFEIDADGKVRI